MIHRLALIALVKFCLVAGAHGATQHASLASREAWKLPSFVKGHRVTSSPTSVSSFLLQVRGGSDNWGRDDTWDSGYPNYNEYNDTKKPKSDNRYSSQDYSYRDDKTAYSERRKPRGDDYYGDQDRNYPDEDDPRYDRDYDDRGTRSVSCLLWSLCFYLPFISLT